MLDGNHGQSVGILCHHKLPEIIAVDFSDLIAPLLRSIDDPGDGKADPIHDHPTGMNSPIQIMRNRVDSQIMRGLI